MESNTPAAAVTSAAAKSLLELAKALDETDERIDRLTDRLNAEVVELADQIVAVRQLAESLERVLASRTEHLA